MQEDGFYHNLDKLEPFLKRLVAGERLLFVALGDSNTDNTHFTSGAKQWPEILHEQMKRVHDTQAVRMLNSGVSGNTTEDALQRWETDVARFQPDLTIVCLGTNDAGKIGVERFERGLREIIRRLQEIGSLVVLRTPTPTWQKDQGYNRIWPEDTARQEVARKIVEIAEELDLPLVDTFHMWSRRAAEERLDMHDLMFDPVHINAKGHKLVARDLAPAFRLE